MESGTGCWKKQMLTCNELDTGSSFARRESEQTSNRCLFARSSGEPIDGGMAIDDPGQPAVGAPSDSVEGWQSIDWQATKRLVRRLQVRIAKAVQEKRWGKVRSLQRILTRSLAAKRLAVRRVTSNRGKRTAGIDGVLWSTSRKKMQAVEMLGRRGYRPQPLRRIYIPKRNGRRRPLGIPTMKDRAVQALHLLALEPVTETLADPHSYGFRPKRSIQDAHGQCYVVLAKSYGPEWVFDADIEACYDELSHPWLLANVPMDKSILAKWLKSGYMEGSAIHATEKGTPQGGIISPALANFALDGLEDCAKSSVSKRSPKTAPRSKVHLIRYADDLIATARTREMLEDQVIPAITAFLKERGLRFSAEKSQIVHINDGFEFLGAFVRKQKGKFLMKPKKASVVAVCRDLKGYIRNRRGLSQENLIQQLNRRLRGWANAFRHLVASRAFRRVDHCLKNQLWRWACKRHGNKGKKWVWQRYYRRQPNGWKIFSCWTTDKKGRWKATVLFQAYSLRIRRHVKIQANAKVYDPAYDAYFEERRKLQRNARQRDYYRWQEKKQLELPWVAQT